MGKLAEVKTKQTENNVEDFIKSVADEQKRDASKVLLQLMQKATKNEPKIWGSSIIGFGNLIYESPKTGRQVEWFKIGFSPRKTNITIYLNGNTQRFQQELDKLGKHKTGVGCLYINKLDDVDMKVLQKIMNDAAKSK